MNDKELLELAAKAMQSMIIGLSELGGSHFQDRQQHFQVRFQDGTYLSRWNPLEDDGDALRLAVKLDFCITQWRNHSEYPPHVMVWYSTGPKSASNWIQEYEQDEMAANRRAIVCAAAEIGKAMP